MLPAWLMSALFAGGGALASKFGSKNKGTPGGVQGPQVITMPQYSFTEPRLNLTSDFITQNLQNMMEGKLPAYYEAARPKMREAAGRDLKETYFGRPGERAGLTQMAQEVGASSGLGPKGTQAQVSKQFKDYSRKEQQIDEFLTQLGVDVAREGAMAFPQMSTGMPAGPQSTVIGPYAYGGNEQPSQLGGFLGQIAGSLPSLMKQGGEGENPIQSLLASIFGGKNGTEDIQHSGGGFDMPIEYPGWGSSEPGGFSGFNAPGWGNVESPTSANISQPAFLNPYSSYNPADAYQRRRYFRQQRRR